MSTVIEMTVPRNITAPDAYAIIREHVRMLAYILRSDLFDPQHETWNEVIHDIARISVDAIDVLDELQLPADNDRLSDVTRDFIIVNALCQASIDVTAHPTRPVPTQWDIQNALAAEIYELEDRFSAREPSPPWRAGA